MQSKIFPHPLSASAVEKKRPEFRFRLHLWPCWIMSEATHTHTRKMFESGQEAHIEKHGFLSGARGTDLSLFIVTDLLWCGGFREGSHDGRFHYKHTQIETHRQQNWLFNNSSPLHLSFFLSFSPSIIPSIHTHMNTICYWCCCNTLPKKTLLLNGVRCKQKQTQTYTTCNFNPIT